mmetsp:Transcript_8217/g.27003  ORF Transcript_8217/g.27003 Transcript_8217/m.27003 type:complete len:207 (-) Transcript_8217:706-1326(-)
MLPLENPRAINARESLEQSLRDDGSEGDYLEWVGALNCLDRYGTRVRDPKVTESILGPASGIRLKPLPAAVGEDSVGHVCADVLGAEGGEELLALDEGPPALHQVVHDNDMPLFWVALLEPHDSLVAVPDLGADYFRVLVEEVVEALPRALVGICDRYVAGIGQHLDALEQERDARLEQGQHVVTEVETFLERVDVKDDYRGWPSP